MVSIDNVERGLARYIEEDLLPNLPRDGAKGFAVGVAAALIIRRGGNILREYAGKKCMQTLGLISPDGAVDLDAVRDALKANMPETGVVFDLPLGLSIRARASDIDKLYHLIRKEAEP